MLMNFIFGDWLVEFLSSDDDPFLYGLFRRNPSGIMPPVRCKISYLLETNDWYIQHHEKIWEFNSGTTVKDIKKFLIAIFPKQKFDTNGANKVTRTISLNEKDIVTCKLGENFCITPFTEPYTFHIIFTKEALKEVMKDAIITGFLSEEDWKY